VSLGRIEARFRPSSKVELLHDATIAKAFKGCKNGLYKYEFLDYFDTLEEKMEWSIRTKNDFDRRKAEAQKLATESRPLTVGSISEDDGNSSSSSRQVRKKKRGVAKDIASVNYLGAKMMWFCEDCNTLHDSNDDHVKSKDYSYNNTAYSKSANRNARNSSIAVPDLPTNVSKDFSGGSSEDYDFQTPFSPSTATAHNDVGLNSSPTSSLSVLYEGEKSDKSFLDEIVLGEDLGDDDTDAYKALYDISATGETIENAGTGVYDAIFFPEQKLFQTKLPLPLQDLSSLYKV